MPEPFLRLLGTTKTLPCALVEIIGDSIAGWLYQSDEATGYQTSSKEIGDGESHREMHYGKGEGFQHWVPQGVGGGQPADW